MEIDEVHDSELLDLLNTAPVVNGSMIDRLADDRGAYDWLSEHGFDAHDVDLKTLRRARDTLQEVVRGQEDASSLQRFLAGASYVPALDGERLQWRLEAPAARLPVVTAVLTWGRLRETRAGRLRPCANPDCHLFLLDRSKSNRARWCSTAVCGNRMKARRHSARARETTAE